MKTTHRKDEDDEFTNVYEKWLKTRLNYAVMHVTGKPSNPGFVEAVVNGGACKHHAENVLREELWVRNRYPHSNFFSGKVIAYTYPRQVNEVLDFRFAQDPINKKKHKATQDPLNPVYDVSLRELATVPCWGAPYFKIPTHLLPRETVPVRVQEQPKTIARELRSFGSKQSSTIPAKQIVATPAECQHLLPASKAKRKAHITKLR